MNRAKKSRKNLSWQAARQKTINRSLFSVLSPTGRYTHSKLEIATDAFSKEASALDPSGWETLVVQPVEALSVIRQMVDIMDKLGCRDLEDLVKYYMEQL